MIEHERAVWEADEATSAETDKDATRTQQSPVPATSAADDEEARHERFMEAAREVMHKHRNVLAALAK